MELTKYYSCDPNELPLDNPVTDGGYCGIFRTLACVGDSLSSGEFESLDENNQRGYHDYFEYSWIQYIARMAGCKAYNFTRGGMTAKVYFESFAEENNFWDPEKAAQGYVIALGVNDILNQNWEIGSTDDICLDDWHKNAKTFMGYYAAIMQRYLDIQPLARFFLVTPPRGVADAEREARGDRLADAIRTLAGLFENAYVIDLRKYGVVYDQAFREKFFLGGHLNAAGYLLTAKMIASYIDYIIRHNMDDFRQIGFIGTPFYYKGLKR